MAFQKHLIKYKSAELKYSECANKLHDDFLFLKVSVVLLAL